MNRIFQTLRRRQFLCWIVAATVSFALPNALIAQAPAGATPRQPAAAPAATAPRPATSAAIIRIDTNFITSDADVVVVLRPAQILTSPNAAVLPIEVASAAGLKYLGQNMADMEEVIAFLKKPKPLVEPIEYGITIKFSKPFNGGAIPQEMRAHAKTGELSGKKYLQSDSPMLPSFFALDPKTLIVAPDATLRKVLERKAPTQPRPFINRIRGATGGNDIYVAVDVTTFRDDLQAMLTGVQPQVQAMTQLPPGSEKLFTAPSLINAMEGSFNLSNSNPSGLLVHANDAAAADQLDKSIAEVVKSQQDAQAALLAASDDPVQKSLVAYKQRMGSGFIKSLRPEKNGARLTFFHSEGPPSQQTLTLISYIGVFAGEAGPMLAHMGPGMASRGMAGPGMPGMPNMGTPATAGDPAMGTPPAQPGATETMPGAERPAATGDADQPAPTTRPTADDDTPRRGR